ncbi:hypothetical protein CLAFUW4_04983 [Fulvia fulva]|uniref:Uncharacterized protein n=1 Tax=Passalora fulva TaxID=5499 RepID=A0A9Q8PIV6_PASFU|nr:uncharacterized protein CLAFUR5_11924 [Fulvia fulva]KAK4626667.1 hypothetical protein CLAFUR4_04969 [Fulvia fulva]KAK4628538.1 hypothetical protein CLAFUR0_04973 [Fulvia fulva]UJO23209.1 hypothetical protein CLAFUR5_11924 [Fulvia fulva]WPV13572.1 hypothetical protein CLAFUW4_04983 [Fulvia fulva]WPV28827.1 hypothetical protein CLAFUW7_04977 [Fulvia fulva]
MAWHCGQRLFSQPAANQSLFKSQHVESQTEEYPVLPYTTFTDNMPTWVDANRQFAHVATHDTVILNPTTHSVEMLLEEDSASRERL